MSTTPPRKPQPDGESTTASLGGGIEPPASSSSLDSLGGRFMRSASLRARRDSGDDSSFGLAAVFPFASELYAVLLFIDVSGFTALTEAFVRAGPHGLEELTGVMNSYFSSILAVVRQYGGDLLKVAGDALIAGFYLFGEETKQAGNARAMRSADCLPHSRSALCSNVVSCAVQLQRSCGEFQAANYSLRLHIAVTAGSTHFIAVGGARQSWIGQQSGGSRRWEFLAAGPALHDLSSTVQQSEAGEVVVSGAAWAECSRYPHFRHHASSAIDGCDNRKLILDLSSSTEHLDPVVASAAELETAPPALCDSLPRQHSALSSGGELSPASFLMPALLCRVPGSASRVNHSASHSSHSYVLSSNTPRASTLPSALGGECSAAPSGSAANDWLAEYRRVSVMFVQLPHPDSCTEDNSVGPHTEAGETECSADGQPGWLLAFHTLFSTVQLFVFDLGGQVRQLLVDDKGCVCIAVFGLSPLTHENDAARAVAASIQIMSRLGKAGHSIGSCRSTQRSPVKVGISTGRAYTGLVGGEHRKEYAVYGDTVNLAARLMAAAAKLDSDKHHILCDEATMRACQQPARFAWHDPILVSVKGCCGPLSVYSPDGMAAGRVPSLLPLPDSPASSVAPSHPQVASAGTDIIAPAAHLLPVTGDHTSNEGFGRHDLFGAVCALLGGSGTTAPATPIAVLESEAGLGKSHLTRRVVQWAQSRGVHTFIGAADSLEVTTPYYALQAVVQSIADLYTDTSLHPQPVSARDHLLSLLEMEYRPFLSVLNDVLPSLPTQPPRQEKDASDELHAFARPRVLQQLLRSLLLGVSNRLPRCLLVVEDTHWLDRESWQLLHSLTSSLVPLPLLITTRPFSKQQPVSSILQSSGVPRVASGAPELLHILLLSRSRHFVLRGLSQRNTARLAAQTLQCNTLSLALQTAIFEQTDGIPLFILHLCHYCRDHHLLQIDSNGTAAILSPGQHIAESLPSSLEALLASVLDRLSPQTQFAMKVASVIGRYFHGLLLQKVLPQAQAQDGEELPDAQLQHLLEHARQHNIIGLLARPAQAQISLVDPVKLSDGLRSTSQPLPRVPDAVEMARRPARATYRFSHQLVRDAAYNSLLYNQRRELHAKVALLLTEWHRSQELPVSIQSLAQHYWLSLCSANEQLVADPEPSLLPLAVDHILQSAASSLSLGSTDAAVVSLIRAIRCVRLMHNADDRERWELRWLAAWMGSHVMLNLAVLKLLAAEFELDPRTVVYFDKSEPRCFGLRAMLILRPFAERLLCLLDRTPASAEWPNSEQRKQVRFNTLAALWYSSLSNGMEAFAAAVRPLRAMADAAVGEERNYLRLEAMCAEASTYTICARGVDLGALVDAVQQDDYFKRLLNGEQRLTRVALGYNVMARLPVDLATELWHRGDTEGSLITMQKFFTLLPSIMHPASIAFGYAHSTRLLLPYGRDPVTVALLQRVAAQMPCEDSDSAQRLMYLVGAMCRLMLAVWQHGTVTAADSAALLSLISAFSTEAHQFGTNFIVAATSLPGMLEYELDADWPLECLEAMADMENRFPLFHCGLNRLEAVRRKAALAIKRVRAGVGDRTECIREAHLLLAEARRLKFGACMLEVKLACTQLELVRLQGAASEADESAAREQLQAALTEVQSSQLSPTIRRAHHLLHSR